MYMQKYIKTNNQNYILKKIITGEGQEKPFRASPPQLCMRRYMDISGYNKSKTNNYISKKTMLKRKLYMQTGKVFYKSNL